MMLLKYQFEVEDYKNQMSFLLKKRYNELGITKISRIYCIIQGVIIGSIFILLFIFIPNENTVIYENIKNGNLAAFFLLFILLFAGYRLNASVKSRIMANLYYSPGAHAGTHLAELKENSFVHTTNSITTEIDLEAIREIAIREGYLHAFYDSLSLISIPVTAFNSDEDQNDFVARLSAASGATVSPV